MKQVVDLNVEDIPIKIKVAIIKKASYKNFKSQFIDSIIESSVKHNCALNSRYESWTRVKAAQLHQLKPAVENHPNTSLSLILVNAIV